jgi:hypothetical protein
MKNSLRSPFGLIGNHIDQFKEEITQMVKMPRAKKFCTQRKDCESHIVIRKMVQNSGNTLHVVALEKIGTGFHHKATFLDYAYFPPPPA